MHKGELGTENLNREIRDTLNPNGQALRAIVFRWATASWQTRNNYDKEYSTEMSARIIRV